VNRSRGICTTLLALVSVAAVLVTQAPGAAADTAAFSDRHNDAPRNIDIERVRVVNAQRIVVNVLFDNLRRTSGGLTVYYDTRGPDHGPEYMAAGGLAQDTDWNAARIEGWNDQHGQLLLRCDIDMRINYRKDRATFDVARPCFDRPGRIRVAARSNTQSSSQRDWAPRHQRFHDWVRR